MASPDEGEGRMDIDTKNGRRVVEPRTRARYSLDELLAQCDAAEGPADEDRDWLDARPVGKELL